MTRKSAIYPSSLRIFAIATRTFVDGIVVSDCLAIPALRILVSMSLIGSLTLIRPLSLPSRFPLSLGRSARLPTRLRHAWKATNGRKLPETDPAESELPHIRPAAPTQVTAIYLPNLKLCGTRCPHDQTLLGHSDASDSPPGRSSWVAPFAQTASRAGSRAAAPLHRSSRWSRD